VLPNKRFELNSLVHFWCSPQCHGDNNYVAFLSKWGDWSFERFVELREITSLQEKVRQGLISGPAKWFTRQHSDLWFGHNIPDYPYYSIQTHRCEGAIKATVTIDLLRRLKFKTCARPDCAAPFAISSKRKRKYCSQYCGHLQSVRKNRKKQGKIVRNASALA
jgi:hypothetical protein